jgi:2-polyprenyl-6-methoxyphenol hydroxylase-like FAD-dependent oxidoreductase
VTTGFRQAGIVLLGDAFATSCPAAGTGCNKVFTDVERLCNTHIPDWLATPGMAREKIENFYDDPVKNACDKHSAAKAYFLRSLSTETGLAWQARRWVRFIGRLGIGSLRQARQRFRAG